VRYALDKRETATDPAIRKNRCGLGSRLKINLYPFGCRKDGEKRFEKYREAWKLLGNRIRANDHIEAGFFTDRRLYRTLL